MRFLENKYNISISKFFRNSVNLKSTSGRPICETNRTFQWAELTAKMYKVLGILNEDEHSNKYMPVHFTDKRKIDLQKGTFGPEWILYIPEIIPE